MKKPNFFIIGAPKCGTTSLATWLSEHPNIYMSPIKEPHFYSADLPKYRAVKTKKEYDLLFKEADPSRHYAVGEASVYYLFSRVAVPQIEREHPGAKYIVMVRNPVDMAYSLHEQLIVSGNEHIRDFAKAWELSPERRQGRAVSWWCKDPKVLDYQSICKLGEQLERLFKIVSRERVLVLILDDIKENPRREYLKVLDFLEVPDDGRTIFPVKNPAKELRWPFVQKGVRLVGEWWVALKRLVGIPRHVGRTGILKTITRFNVRHRPRNPMSEDLRQQLSNYFRQDVEKLSNLIGRDLTYWLEK
ncbi:MAG TPA: sulfotransferase [Deltaproteobacteria bacterium]|nr:MAG: sulfotransferase [Deltaproteobacteria bacterium]HDM78515.1 sulfotransferase [Deltaproteobacteria bacterium]